MTRRGWMASGESWSRLAKPAQDMRRALTPAEAALWARIRNRQLAGLRFRRQHVIDRFIVDFYCAEHKLVAEVDGQIHESQTERDEERDARLVAPDLVVARFSNDDVLSRMDAVLQSIERYAASTSSSP